MGVYYNQKRVSSPCIPGLIIVECWNVVPCEFCWDFPFIGMGGIASMPPLTAVAPVPMGSIPVVGMSPPLVSSVPAAGVPPLANGAPPVIQPLPAFAHPGTWPAKATGWSSICISLLFSHSDYIYIVFYSIRNHLFFFSLIVSCWGRASLERGREITHPWLPLCTKVNSAADTNSVISFQGLDESSSSLNSLWALFSSMYHLLLFFSCHELLINKPIP